MSDSSSHEPRRSIHSFGLSSSAERLLKSLASRGENEGSQRIMLDGLQPGASQTFTSLNEIVQNDRERLEATKLTEQYFSPDDVGRQRPTVKTTHEGRHVHLQEGGTTGSHEGGKPIRREETFHSTTATLVGSSNASISEGHVGRSMPTIVIGEDSEDDDSRSDLYAMSPILGVKRLPSVYDAETRTANGDYISNNQSFRTRSSTNIARSDRLPLASTPDPLSAQDTPPTDEAPASNVDGSAPEQSTTPTNIEQETSQESPPTRPTTRSSSRQPGESLVESSVLLQVAIVGRSRENLPIPLDHSTLEYVEFIETASHRQYSFTSEHLGVPTGGLLRRSTSGIRRMLSAKSRSILKRLQREFDIEMQNSAALQDSNDQMDGPVELDATPAGPYEVGVSPNNENWGRWGARQELRRDGTFTKSETLSRMTCAIFGPNLPRQLSTMCKVYMAQLDEQLASSMKNHELQTPNTLNWPNPLSYLEECLKIVANKMDSTMSIEGFVQQNMGHLMLLMEQGPVAARITPTPEHNPVVNKEYLKIAHEWMLFCLEAWTMIDMTAICKNRHDLRLSENFCKSPLKETIESLLPRLIVKYIHHNNTPYTNNGVKANQIFPHEMTAEMLQELAGVRFVWTNDITNHLALNTKEKTVGLYSHVAFAYLHAEAGTESSLNKSGLVPYHHLLTEVAESYLLLFGNSERSRKLFNNIHPEGRSPGYFDIFSLNGRLDSIKPKWLYNANEDFPVFGDRLIGLKSLFKPKGLRGLWRDTRDSLQWYTFWAVVVIGAISLFLGVVQTVLGALQAYASLKALHP